MKKFLILTALMFICGKVFATPVSWTQYNSNSIYNMCANTCSPNVATTGSVDLSCLNECIERVTKSNINFRLFEVSPTYYISMDGTNTYALQTYYGNYNINLNGTTIATFTNLVDAQTFFSKFLKSHFTTYNS